MATAGPGEGWGGGREALEWGLSLTQRKNEQEASSVMGTRGAPGTGESIRAVTVGATSCRV